MRFREFEFEGGGSLSSLKSSVNINFFKNIFKWCKKIFF